MRLEINEIRNFTRYNKYITTKPIAFSLSFRIDGLRYEETEYG